MQADDRAKVTPHEEQMIRGYVRSLSTPQLICLMSVSKYELGAREGNAPQDKRGILKPAARERLSRDPIFDLEIDLPEIQAGVGSVATEEEPVDEHDPLGMGFE